MVPHWVVRPYRVHVLLLKLSEWSTTVLVVDCHKNPLPRGRRGPDDTRDGFRSELGRVERGKGSGLGSTSPVDVGGDSYSFTLAPPPDPRHNRQRHRNEAQDLGLAGEGLCRSSVFVTQSSVSPAPLTVGPRMAVWTTLPPESTRSPTSPVR